jgi:hypothetical protein
MLWNQLEVQLYVVHFTSKQENCLLQRLNRTFSIYLGGAIGSVLILQYDLITTNILLSFYVDLKPSSLSLAVALSSRSASFVRGWSFLPKSRVQITIVACLKLINGRICILFNFYPSCNLCNNRSCGLYNYDSTRTDYLSFGLHDRLCNALRYLMYWKNIVAPYQ